MSDVAAVIAGPTSVTPVPGALGAPGVGVTPAPGAAFAWATDLDAPVVDLLKSKGMHDDPVKGANALARSYYEANKALSGADVILRPADWTKVEDVEKYLGKTRGVATPAEYKATFAEGVTINPALMAFSQKLAFDWGVPPAVFQKGIDAWTAFAKEQGANHEVAQAKANDDGIKALRGRVGEEAYTAGVANAQSVYKALAAKGQISRETLAALDKSIGSAPLMELLFAIGAGMKAEGAVLQGNAQTPTDPSQMTQEQAKAEIARLQGDAEFQKAYTDGSVAGKAAHNTAVERMRLLFEAQTRQKAA